MNNSPRLIKRYIEKQLLDDKDVIFIGETSYKLPKLSEEDKKSPARIKSYANQIYILLKDKHQGDFKINIKFN